ncbi:NUDIX hydrolase domain-like protein, partial [Coemansia spiralis]
QEAAVLVLLCTVNNKPHVVFEERTAILSSHAGEVCFPGGKADPHETLEETALRETEEELGISRNRIRVVGAVDPVPSKDYRLRVHPFVGVLSEWAVEVNSAEVHRAFVMPLEHFYRSKRVMRFRDSDMVVPVYASDKAGLEIWGLTAFILSQVVRRI